MKSSGLFREYRISFRVTVIVAAPLARPLTSMNRSLPVHGIDEPLGDDQQSSQHHRGQRRDLRLEPEFLKPFLETCLQHVRALAGLP